MSRYCGEINSAPILNAAEKWRDRCLLHNAAIFSNSNIWTEANVEQLIQYYVENLDWGDGDFFSKLKQQLAPISSEAKQLAAEMIWFMLLCPDNISPNKKRENVNTILSWSNISVIDRNEFLTDEVLGGIGSGGTAYNQLRWMELVYFVKLINSFFKESIEQRKTLLNDRASFAKWLERIDGNENRQLRHMLLFLLFPDVSERIFGSGDRLKIARALSNYPSKELGKLTARELDNVLLEIRNELESRYSTKEIDWYTQPVRSLWKEVELTKQDVLDALDEIDKSGIAASEKSSTYDLVFQDKRYPPKLVYSIAHKYAGGAGLDRTNFAGGERTECFKVLRKLGFEITQKESKLNFWIEKTIVSGRPDVNQVRMHLELHFGHPSARTMEKTSTVKCAKLKQAMSSSISQIIRQSQAFL